MDPQDQKPTDDQGQATPADDSQGGAPADDSQTGGGEEPQTPSEGGDEAPVGEMAPPPPATEDAGSGDNSGDQSAA